MVHKVLVDVPEDVLLKDMEKYREKAIEVGATDARIITTDQVIIDERVRAKCMVPICGSYGKTPVCPPNSPDLDLIRKVVSNFKYAVFYMIKVPSDQLCGPEFKSKKLGRPSAMQHWEVASRVESAAFYDGYHLTMAFAGGPCEPYFCPDHTCTVLEGKGCPWALQIRPSMESVGMDAMTMAIKVGWDIYPIGGSLVPEDVPHGTKLGLVLIY